MKVCYIFREKERNGHSIENLFDTISLEVEKHGVCVEKWYKPNSFLKSILEVRRIKADVFHITGACYYLSIFLPWDKTIMTVHDIGMYKNHPRTLKRKIFVLLSFVLPFKLLKISTAISELTKDDLVNILKINPTKVQVIPNPLILSITFSPIIAKKSKPTILQIGTGIHKNLNGLIEAVKNIDCHLDIVGNPDEYLIAKMKEYKIEYSVSNNITNEQMIIKYQNCDILFFASLSEGFGLPILEAQAIGRPVITSNTEPTKSVCGLGGILVNPYDILEIKKAISELIQEKSKCIALVNKGLKNVSYYKKEEIAQKYLSLYRSLLN